MSANISENGGSRAGSFPWFVDKVLPHIVSSLLTITGLISTWLLFGADEVSKIWETQRAQDLAAFENTLQTQREKELEVFKDQLNQPNLEYGLALSDNPMAQFAPEEITESIRVENTGTDTAMNVRIRGEFIIPISGEAEVSPPRDGMSIQPLDPRSVEITFSKLQVQDSILISVRLRRQDILNLGTTAEGFLASQALVVTCDGNCKSEQIAASVPPQAFYVVESGDTLSAIANKLDISPIDLITSNAFLSNADSIYPGQVLAVP